MVRNKTLYIHQQSFSCRGIINIKWTPNCMFLLSKFSLLKFIGNQYLYGANAFTEVLHTTWDIKDKGLLAGRLIGFWINSLKILSEDQHLGIYLLSKYHLTSMIKGGSEPSLAYPTISCIISQMLPEKMKKLEVYMNLTLFQKFF